MSFLFEPKLAAPASMADAVILVVIAAASGLALALFRGVILPDEKRSAPLPWAFLAACAALAFLLLPNDIARAMLLVSFPFWLRADRDAFWALFVGFLCGVSAPGFGLALALAAILLWQFRRSRSRRHPHARTANVTITIPEDLKNPGIFDAAFGEYTLYHKLVGMRTVDLGMFFELSYRAALREDADIQSFLNALRSLNGNLSVSLLQDTPEMGSEARSPWLP